MNPPCSKCRNLKLSHGPEPFSLRCLKGNTGEMMGDFSCFQEERRVEGTVASRGTPLSGDVINRIVEVLSKAKGKKSFVDFHREPHNVGSENHDSHVLGDLTITIVIKEGR